MAWTVKIRYADGAVRSVERLFADVTGASAFALRLADDLGRTYTSYGARPARPVSVALYDHRALVIDIAVFEGGLSPDRPFEGPLDLSATQ